MSAIAPATPRPSPPRTELLGPGGPESWTEVNLLPVTPLDGTLLTNVVEPIVHGELAGEVETWFFFWEPELRLRIRWLDPDRDEELQLSLAASLELLRATGLFSDWYEGTHGQRGGRYSGEAETYGESAWPLLQKDWMNGSELALLLARLERDGAVEKPRDFQWKRHVHLFTNQLYGSWNDEIELCLSQALGYLRALREQGIEPTEATREAVAELSTLADQA